MTDDSPGAGAGRGTLPRYLAAALFARTADEGARVSLVLLALHTSRSAALGGALVAALLVPHVVAGPLVGTWLDRARRPRVVLTGALLVLAGSLLAVALLLGRAPLALVVPVLLVGGCAGPAVTGGLTCQLPTLVGPDRTARAFGLDSLFYNVASIAGPALAGLVGAAAGPVAGQGVLAGSAALGALGVVTLPLRPSPHPAGGARPGPAAGVQAILAEPTLRVVTLASTLGQVGPGGLALVATVLAATAHRPGAAGLLLSAVAAGSLVGSLLWTWRPIAPQRPALVSTAAMLGVGLPLAVAAVVSPLPGVAALFALSGVFVGPFASALFTARDRYAPAAVRTSVFTIGAGLKVTASAAGAALFGLATGLPVPAQLLLVAASPLLAGALGTLLLVGRGDARGRSRLPSAVSPGR
jgi:MFS family permease